MATCIRTRSHVFTQCVSRVIVVLWAFWLALTICAQRAVLPKTSQRSVPNVMSCPKLKCLKNRPESIPTRCTVKHGPYFYFRIRFRGCPDGPFSEKFILVSTDYGFHFGKKTTTKSQSFQLLYKCWVASLIDMGLLMVSLIPLLSLCSKLLGR